MFEPGVESRKSMVGSCIFCHQKAHRVTFVTKARLLADKDIAECFAKDVKTLAVGKHFSGSIAPK